MSRQDSEGHTLVTSCHGHRILADADCEEHLEACSFVDREGVHAGPRAPIRDEICLFQCTIFTSITQNAATVSSLGTEPRSVEQNAFQLPNTSGVGNPSGVADGNTAGNYSYTLQSPFWPFSNQMDGKVGGAESLLGKSQSFMEQRRSAKVSSFGKTKANSSVTIPESRFLVSDSNGTNELDSLRTDCALD